MAQVQTGSEVATTGSMAEVAHLALIMATRVPAGRPTTTRGGNGDVIDQAGLTAATINRGNTKPEGKIKTPFQTETFKIDASTGTWFGGIGKVMQTAATNDNRFTDATHRIPLIGKCGFFIGDRDFRSDDALMITASQS